MTPAGLDEARRMRRVLVGCLVGLSVFVVHCRGTLTCFDSMWSVPTAISIWDHGDANLDEYHAALEARQYLFTEPHRRHVYTQFPIGTSLLVAPAIPVLRSLASVALSNNPARLSRLEARQDASRCTPVPGEPLVRLHSLVELVLASAIVSMTTIVIFAIASVEGLGMVGAVAVALIFAFGTSAWSTASRSLWQHGPSMLMLSLALLTQITGRFLPVGGALLGFSYVIRPTNAIPIVMATAWSVITRGRRAIGFCAGIALVLGTFFLANQQVYRAWLPPYYQAARLGSPTFWVALAGDLISPGRGLFVFSPVLAFAFYGVVLKVRAGRFGWLDGSLVASIVLHWIAIAAFPHWWAGYSYGPRFFADMLPYFIYFLIPVVAWLAATSGASARLLGATFVAAAVFSVFVHAEGALTFRSIMWNHLPRSVDNYPERLWDWRDPQFLAGVLRDGP
jgi:hypothetical protein